MKENVPGPIWSAAAAMLAPYGVDLNRLQLVAADNVGAKFMSVKEVEYAYGIGRWSIGRLIKRGKIAAAKMSPARAGKVLVDTESLERFLADSKINNNGGPNDR